MYICHDFRRRRRRKPRHGGLRNALADVVTARRAPALRGTLLDPTAMRAFAHPSAFAARSTGVARRFPSPPPRASRARLAVAARASSEDASRPETSRGARRDVHAPRSYTREYSVDGDESYSLLDASQGFGPPDTAMAVGSTWGGGDDERPLDASSRSRLPAAWPDRPDVVTATSTHTRHPHVVSVKLPRPVADHIKFQPRTAPPLSSTFAELRVRARRSKSEDCAFLFPKQKQTKRGKILSDPLRSSPRRTST